MSRYFVKPMYLKRPERLTNWTGGSYIFVHHTKDLKSATSICAVSKKTQQQNHYDTCLHQCFVSIPRNR